MKLLAFKVNNYLEVIESTTVDASVVEDVYVVAMLLEQIAMPQTCSSNTTIG